MCLEFFGFKLPISKIVLATINNMQNEKAAVSQNTLMHSL